MTDLRLSIAVGDYDRTRPLLDGRVKIDGVDPVFMALSPEEMFFRAFRHQAFDVCELSLSSHSVATARGDAPYIGIPAFLSRAFRHSSIYIRNDRGIASPADLKGRRIGIAEYQLTANVWARAILEDEYGVAPRDIIWVRGGMDTPARPEKLKLTLPADIRIEDAPGGRSLNDLLSAGDIDGFVGPRSLRCFDEGHPKVERLFADSATAAEWHKRTGIFPIMHVLGIRRALADEFPFLPAALLKAFEQSKALALTALADTSATKVTMPFVEDQLAMARRLMGNDYWPYGVARNRATLEAFLAHHHRQGLSPRQLAPKDLFHPSTLEAFSI